MNTIIEFKAVDILQKNNIIFQNINFKISAGEFIYIIGKTGSGKSSLLKSLYAELPIKKGSIEILSCKVGELDDNNISELRRKLGIVFQDFQLLTDRNLYDNLLFILEATEWKDKEKIDGRIKEVLDNVHLENCENKMPYELSGGEQQRVAIARALVNEPSFVLADEPTGNVDSRNTTSLMDLFAGLNDEGTTVILITHDQEVAQMSNRQITLRDGRVAADSGETRGKANATAS